ncbi:undecaprenyl-diphosphate phosphatase [Propionibacteriaceae bacterium Y1700]|uniref:undecaprenyl-diphosphate phosphatase n=1 Tax=Microlunatus sp. Y1700 TaxID=3418487 RepID=UPI003DA77B43
MGWFEALILGIVQGLTEFLPISSSAHISIVGQVFFGGHDPGAAFTAMVQLGTETAVLIYFWRDIVRIIGQWAKSLVGKAPRNDPDARMGWLVIIGSIPIGVLGLLFQDQIESTLRNLWITVAMLAGFGVVIAIIDRLARNERTLEQITWKHGILYGCAQALALIPGVSRSGGTIAAGLAMGYKREAAARYSFLLALPAVYASGFYQLAKELKDPSPDTAWGPVVLATVVCFAIALAVIHWLLKFVSTHSYVAFCIYRIAIAAVVAVLLITGVIPPVPAAAG